MKPAAVDYVAAPTVADAAAALASGDEDTKVIAGGQSLLPAMAMRLARPSLLVDVGRIPELRALDVGADHLRVGATVRHVELERATRLPGALGRLLRCAAGHVGHLPIRTRGTFGGSLAHADPAAEWGLVALAAGAEIEATSIRGTRRVAAGDLFETVFTTSLEPDELLTAVDLPLPPPTARAGFAEVSRRAGDFALVACAAVVDLDPDAGAGAGAGAVTAVRFALGGVADRPVRCEPAERALVGRPLDRAAADGAGAVAAASVDARGDLHAGPVTRRAMVAAVVRRALLDARDGGAGVTATGPHGVVAA